MSEQEFIYLDHAATTGCREEVVAAMLPYFSERFGNPSGRYHPARLARRALDDARARVAAVLGVPPREVLFTSGGTESDNLALLGVATAARRQGRPAHVVVSAVEHHAVLHAADAVAAEGGAVSRVAVDRTGQVSAGAVAAALRPETCLVSVMLANNEVGTINPLAAISQVTRARGLPLHTDAVQAAGALALTVGGLGVDLLSLSAHKFGGPKGMGVLWVRTGVGLAPRQHGGGQESRRRAGTENVAGAVGLAVALELAEGERAVVTGRVGRLRERLAAGLRAGLPEVVVNGHPTDRLPGHLHLSIPGVEGDELLLLLDAQGIAASTGSACASGAQEPSHVLMAMGLTREMARSSLRLTLGRTTTEAEIDRAGAIIPAVVAQMREFATAG